MKKITLTAILQALQASRTLQTSQTSRQISHVSQTSQETPECSVKQDFFSSHNVNSVSLDECSDSVFWINAVSTNSREISDLAATGQHTLFVPIVGERVDAHRFLPNAREAGAFAALVSKKWISSEEGQEFLAQKRVRLLSPECQSADVEPDNHTDFICIEVEDTLTAFQTLAAWYRSLFSIPVIGITGSVGKTTTKEMVSAALESALTIHKTAGNQNSQVGLPLTLFGLERCHQAAVIEMGMSEFGEMSRLAAMAKPDHAIITNIGVAHIGNLGSQENIRSEKLHITDFFQEESILFLNADDPLLTFSSDIPQRNLVYFGIYESREIPDSDSSHTEHTTDAPSTMLPVVPESSGTPATSKTSATSEIPVVPAFYASHLQTTGTGQTFLFHYPGGEPEVISLQVLGLHNVRNALAALAVAWKLGISPQTAKQGLAAYAPLAMRGNLIEANGIRILDDSYNASPDSMKSSIEVLASLPDSKLPADATPSQNTSRRFVVFADVKELGERSEALHREVGTFLAKHNRNAGKQNAQNLAPMDYLITVGTESLFIEKAYQEASLPADYPVSCFHFEQNAAAAAFLKTTLQPGDMVLVKGSRGMQTEEIVTALCTET